MREHCAACGDKQFGYGVFVKLDRQKRIDNQTRSDYIKQYIDYLVNALFCDNFQFWDDYADGDKYKKYADLHNVMLEAFRQYKQECEYRTFPENNRTYAIKEEVLEELFQPDLVY